MIRTIHKAKSLNRNALTKSATKSKVGKINSLKNCFGNLNMQQLNESDSIVKRALKESLTQSSNPKKETVYNEEYYQLMRQKRENYAASAIEGHKQGIEERVNHPQSHKASAENKLFLEEVSGLKGGVQTKKLGYQCFLQPEEYRFSDRIDYLPQAVENSVYNQVHNMSQIEVFGEEDLFENVYDNEDHFQKFVDFEDEEFVANLLDNQILITNIVPRTTLQEIEARLTTHKILPDSIKANFNNFGHIINVVLTYNTSNIPNFSQITHKIGTFNFHSSKLQVYTNQDSESENIVNRRIVVTGIPKNMSTDVNHLITFSLISNFIQQVIYNLSELPGFVSAEVPYKYENPNLPSTELLQNTLKKNFQSMGEREALQVYINEHNGESITQIKLTDNFNKSGERIVKGNEFEENSILMDKYSYNLDGKEKMDVSDFANINGEAESNSSRVIEIVDKKYFNSARYPK